MIRANIIIVTFLALGFAWWELSGGQDFVPGEHGVRIMADFDPYRTAPRSRPETRLETPKLTLKFPEQVVSPKTAPRVSSLQERDPSGAKTVSVRVTAPASATSALAPAPVPSLDPALAQGGDPVDPVLAALQAVDAIEPDATDPDPTPDPTANLNDQDLAALLAESIQNGASSAPVLETFDPDPPQPQISGLGGALPLGTSLNGAAAPVVPQTAADLRVVSGTRVNLRGGPSTTYDVVTQLLKGAEVEVLDDTGDGWVRLRTIPGNEVGWMSADFLEAGGR